MTTFDIFEVEMAGPIFLGFEHVGTITVPEVPKGPANSAPELPVPYATRPSGRVTRETFEPYAIAVMDHAGFTVTSEYPGSGAPWPAIHRGTPSEPGCGKQVRPRFSNILMGVRCGACTKRSPGAGRPRMSDAEARWLMQRGGFDPIGEDTYPGAHTPWPSVHVGTADFPGCQQTVHPRYSDVMAVMEAGGRQGCSACRRRTIDAEDRAHGIVTAYVSGSTAEEVAVIYRVDPATVLEAAKTAGVPIRSTRRQPILDR